VRETRRLRAIGQTAVGARSYVQMQRQERAALRIKIIASTLPARRDDRKTEVRHTAATMDA